MKPGTTRTPAKRRNEHADGPQTAALLRTFDNILILTHVRPDGDTVGCAAALCAGLRSLGKTAFCCPIRS